MARQTSLNLLVMCGFLSSFLLCGVRAEASESAFAAELVSATDCCPATLQFELRDLAGGEPRRVSVEARVERYTSHFVYKRTLVIEGELRYGGTIVILVDADRGTVNHVFWTYGHAFSRSKRYLAYRTHYPRLGGFAKSVVAVFDLDKSVNENRRGITLDERFPRSVGRPVYPTDNAFRHSLVLDEATPRIYTSPFAWSQDERHLAFVAIHFDESGSRDGRMVLVVTEPFPAAAGAVSWQRELDFSDYAISSNPSSLGGEHNEWAAIDDLRWSGSEIIITPDGLHVGELPAEIRIELPGSSSAEKQ